MRRLRTLLLLVPLLLVGASAQAQASWSTPFDVTGADTVSWFPDIAIGPDSSVHIIWATGVADPTNKQYGVQDLLGYRSQRNGIWSTPNNIANPGGTTAASRNSIVFGPDGRLHVLVRSEFRIDYTNAPWSDAWSARSWSTPYSLNGSGTPYYNAMAVDDYGVIHAIYTQAVPDDPAHPRTDCSGCSDLFYRQTRDFGAHWSDRVDLIPFSDGVNRPQIKIDRAKRIHIVWSEGFDFIVGKGKSKDGVYLRSDDEGRTWTQPVRFSIADQPIQQMSITLTKQGDPFVVFRAVNDGRVYFQRSSDGGDNWGALGEIPGVIARDINDNNLDKYALATDSANRVHLLMVGFHAGKTTAGISPRLLHLVWDGTHWSAPNDVMANDLYPEWPQLVINAGNQLHAVWFTRHVYDLYGSDKGAHYQVWYSTLTTDAPAVAPPPTFTSVPTTVPTVLATSTPTPSPTPLPASILAAPTTDGPPRWEQQGVVMMAMALLPTFGVLGLIIGGIIAVRRRHR